VADERTATENPLPDLLAGDCKLLDIFDIEIRERLANALIQAVLLQEIPIRLGRGGEAAGHVHAGIRERADHFAERRVLAADDLHIAFAQALEGQDEFVQGNPQCCVHPLPGVTRDETLALGEEGGT
jgi:hypothetical protein